MLPGLEHAVWDWSAEVTEVALVDTLAWATRQVGIYLDQLDPRGETNATRVLRMTLGRPALENEVIRRVNLAQRGGLMEVSMPHQGSATESGASLAPQPGAPQVEVPPPSYEELLNEWRRTHGGPSQGH
ncbi:hypothetical protein MMPV_009602 [Pyropia vietnamensis]